MARLLRMKALFAAAISLVAGEGAAASDPMDLRRTDARSVELQVVIASPRDGRLSLSPLVRGRFEAGPAKNQRTVTVPGAEVERVLLPDQNPVAASFSDFVWTFDADTGSVLSASLSGLVDQPIHVGPMQLVARVAISFALSTQTRAGYGPPHPLAGQTVVSFCDPDASECTAARNADYDASTGWVQANGPVCAVWHSFQTRAYTTLGHARFFELDPGDGGGDAPAGLGTRRAERSSDPAC